MGQREIRVRPVVRYIITDWSEGGTAAQAPRRSIALGEHQSAAVANEVAAAIHVAVRARGHPDARLFTAPELRIERDARDVWRLREVA